MEQMETAQRLASCSFGVSGVPFWGKLRASIQEKVALFLQGRTAACPAPEKPVAPLANPTVNGVP